MDIIKKLSVVIDGKTISNKNSAETFVYSINYLSNKIGKEILKAYDFITMEMLFEILSKNGINVNI
jgi:hypothetical protein